MWTQSDRRGQTDTGETKKEFLLSLFFFPSMSHIFFNDFSRYTPFRSLEFSCMTHSNLLCIHALRPSCWILIILPNLTVILTIYSIFLRAFRKASNFSLIVVTWSTSCLPGVTHCHRHHSRTETIIKCSWNVTHAFVFSGLKYTSYKVHISFCSCSASY